MGKQVAFLVDGFNLYHSVRDLERDYGGRYHWLNIKQLCHSHLAPLGPDAHGAGVYYFSAFAEHLANQNPGVVKRHKAYVSALKATGVEVEMARFKAHDVHCTLFGQDGACCLSDGEYCSGEFVHHEEKETDVALASKLLELALTTSLDSIVLLSGDTDYIPAIKTARRLKPGLEVCALLPYKRNSNQMRQECSRAFSLDRDKYDRFRLPDRVAVRGGQPILKPNGW